MAKATYTDEELLETVQAYHTCNDNQRATADLLGLAPSTISLRLHTAEKRGLMLEKGGSVEAFKSIVAPLPKGKAVKRYLLTCAQNNTKLHEPFWKNLKAMAAHYNAQILISTFRYNKEAFDNAKAAKRRKLEAELGENAAYPAEIHEFISNERIDLAPRLTWCGELQIMPTARRPLTGFENYTYRKSTIVPHTTIALQSIAGMKEEGVKMLYTTGCVTQRNYIQRREGFRAEHFHAYAALLVEVNALGQWWCRQVQQGEDGTLCDLALTFKNGRLTSEKTRVACITWGDIHAAKLDPEVARCCWGGEGSMLDALRPYRQHVHDLLDMSVRSHHTRRDPFEVYRNYIHAERGSVASELRKTGHVLLSMTRPWCDTVVVNSNHDRHLHRFLQEVDWRDDMENAELILELTLHSLKALRERDTGFYLVQHALGIHGPGAAQGRRVRFLREDESDIILKHIEGGIECGIHGDRGANGAKGSSRGFATYGRRTNTADKHFAAITDLNYQSGLSGLLDQGYNHGLSSWTHSHTVTYNNGQRTIIGVYAGRYCA